MNRPGSALLVVASCVLLASIAWSEEIVQRIEWQELAAANALSVACVWFTKQDQLRCRFWRSSIPVYARSAMPSGGV